MTMPLPAPRRVVCEACRRPVVVCYCHLIKPTLTRTRILFLQHARESRMPIGTARLAHLGLPSSALHSGVRFEDDAAVSAWLANAPRAHLLFPGPTAKDISELPSEDACDLVVVDGTWGQAQKLLRLNPLLQALPRVAFQPREPSRYQIRKEPEAFCVSTIEAVAEVLGTLEPQQAPYDNLLAPFLAMVEGQLRFAREVKSHRHAEAKRARARTGASVPKPTFPERVREAWSRLVCVQGEANAWPSARADRPAPEIVHWVAARPADGSRFEAVVVPTGPIAPNIPTHIGLPAEAIAAGMARARWLEGWRSFLRPDDILVHWGSFHQNLAAAEGLAVTELSWDLRFEISRWQKKRVGLLEDGIELLGATTAPRSPAGELTGTNRDARDTTTAKPDSQARALLRLEGLVQLLRAAEAALV